MIKGTLFIWVGLSYLLSAVSVMSGIITNPHFRKYFQAPGAIEVGTMVAVLELGALGMYPFQYSALDITDICIQQRPLLLDEWATSLAEKAPYLSVPLSLP
jgi:hypothetical protein